MRGTTTFSPGERAESLRREGTVVVALVAVSI
jgi:hypothetical protein